MIYEMLFSRLPGLHKIVKYHLCDKKYVVTTNARKFRRRRRRTRRGLTSILGTCKKVHDEALPFLCKHAKFIATLRPAPNPLDLSSPLDKHLAHAKTLKLNISIDCPCRIPQTLEETEPPSAARTARRGSWNGGPSVEAHNPTTDAPRPSTRTRRKTWTSAAPPKMSPEMRFATYLLRLDSLLGALEYGVNLRRLDIHIYNTDRTLNAQSLGAILSHMEARLRVREECCV